MPGRAAFVDGRGGSSMRLNFSGVGEDEIREGIRRIGEVVREQVAMYGTLTGAQPADRPQCGARRGGRPRRAQPRQPDRQTGVADGRAGQGPAAARQAQARRIEVIREPRRGAKGGRSLERQVSLRSGARVEDALERLGHEVTPIDVGADLVEQLSGDRPDVAFVALHGRDGEDGTVQELLEVMGIPYTGSGVSACIRAADKVLAKHAMRDGGIPTPDFYAFNETAFEELGAAQALPAIEERLQFPIVVKPAAAGLGARDQVRAHRRPTSPPRWSPPSPTTARCCSSATSHGRELAVSILDDGRRAARAADRRGGAPSRRTSTTSSRATRSAARGSSARPSSTRSPNAQRDRARDVRAARLRGFARVDLMLSATGELYVLEVNPIPG